MALTEWGEYILRNLQPKNGKLDSKKWYPLNPVSVYLETFNEKVANWMPKYGARRIQQVYIEKLSRKKWQTGCSRMAPTETSAYSRRQNPRGLDANGSRHEPRVCVEYASQSLTRSSSCGTVFRGARRGGGGRRERRSGGRGVSVCWRSACVRSAGALCPGPVRPA